MADGGLTSLVPDDGRANVRRQLQVDDPSSPANALSQLVRWWSDWRAQQGSDPTQPPVNFSAPGAAMIEPTRHGLQSLMQWVEANTDKALRPSGTAGMQRQALESVFSPGYGPPIYPHDPTKGMFPDSSKPMWDLPRRATTNPEKFQDVQDRHLLDLFRDLLQRAPKDTP